MVLSRGMQKKQNDTSEKKDTMAAAAASFFRVRMRGGDVARGNQDRINKAEKMYLLGEKLKDIARKLDVPEGTVRRWKSTYKWGLEQSERSDKKSERFDTKSERSEDKKANIRKAKKSGQAAGSEDISESGELTDKQRLFCIYYVKCFNATTAYQKAYGCKYQTAMINASRMLRNAKVKSEIEKLKKERVERDLFSMDDIIQRYKDIAFADMNDYVEIKDNKVYFKDSDNFDGSLLKKVSSGKVNSIERLDPLQALKWLAEHTGGDEDTELDDGFLDALNAAAEEDWENDADEN